MDQMKMKFLDIGETAQTILCDSLKYTRDSFLFKEIVMTKDTGYIRGQKKKSARDSFLATITTNSESCFALHIFLQSVQKLPVLVGKKIIRTI